MLSVAEMKVSALWRGRWIRFGLAVAAIVLAADQISKWLILDIVMTRSVEVTGFFNLVMVWNPGVTFGMFGDGGEAGRWILSGLALAISAFLLNWLRQVDRRFPALAIGMVIGGAIGNVVDRVRFGAVADFLDVHLCFGAVGEFLIGKLSTCHWPAFNLADSAIMIGVVLLVIDSLFGPQEAADGEGGDRTET